MTITVDGLPFAVLQPLSLRSRWVSRTDFANQVLSRQADPALAQDLAQLASETIDMLPL